MNRPSEFDRAEAIEEIRRIILIYPEVSDTGDLSGVGRFLDGSRLGHFEVPEEEMPVASADTAAEQYGQAVIYYPDGISHAKHLITNVDIAFSKDAQTARSHSTYVVLQARPELPLQPICTGRYEDTLRRLNGRWKLTVRRECMDLKGDLSFHVRSPEHLEATPHLQGDPVWFAPTKPDMVPIEAAGPPPFDRPLATEQIRRIILAYPERVDRGDFAGVGALLEGVRIGGALGRKAHRIPDEEMRSMTAKDIEELYRASVLTYEDGLPHTKHLITNIDIQFVPDRPTAMTRSYYTVLQGMDSFPLQVIISGRYDDEFHATDGGWKLVARREYADLVGNLSNHVSAGTLRELSA
jgi:3-phenylpropionate/cinnamic acid dioxygenase small subunit